jgi:hypothetical protein
MAAGLGGCATTGTGGSSNGTTFGSPLVKVEYYGPTTTGHTLTQVLNISPRVTKEGILIVDSGDVRIPSSPPNDKMRYIHHFVYDPKTGIVLQWTGKATGKAPDVWNLYFYIVTDPKIERVLNSLAANPAVTCTDSECAQIIQVAGGWDSVFMALVQSAYCGDPDPTPRKASTIYCADQIPYTTENHKVQDMWRMVTELFWSPAGVHSNPYNLKDGTQKPYAVLGGKKYKLGQRPDQDVFLYNFGQGSTRMAGNLIIAQAAPEYFDGKNDGLIIKNLDAEKIALKLRSPQAISALKEILKEKKK